MKKFWLVLSLAVSFVPACGGEEPTIVDPNLEEDPQEEEQDLDVLATIASVTALPAPQVDVSEVFYEGWLDGELIEYNAATAVSVEVYPTYYGGWFAVEAVRETVDGSSVTLRMQFSGPENMTAGTVVQGRDRSKGYLLSRVSMDGFDERADSERIEFQSGLNAGEMYVEFDLLFPGTGNHTIGTLLITDLNAGN